MVSSSYAPHAHRCKESRLGLARKARALQSERADGLKQAVVTPGNHITGVVSVNTALHRSLKECFTEVTLRDVAQRNLIIAREDEVVFNIMTRMTPA
jgi:hypothetical protein